MRGWAFGCTCSLFVALIWSCGGDSAPGGAQEDRPPSPTNDVVETDEDTPVQFSPIENDLDPEEGTLVITEVTVPSHGTANIDGAQSGVEWWARTHDMLAVTSDEVVSAWNAIRR